MSKKNKNLRKGIVPDLSDVSQNTATPEPSQNTATPEPGDVVLENTAPIEQTATSDAPATEPTQFVATAENAPEGFGWCAICKQHRDITLLNSTSERNVYSCKAFCKPVHNIVNLAKNASDAARAAKRSKKTSEPRPPSKVSKIVAYISDKNVFTVREISEISGHDLKNASVSLTILKNPARTKNPIPFYYAPARKLWVRTGYDLSSGSTETAQPAATVSPETAQVDAASTGDAAPVA